MKGGATYWRGSICQSDLSLVDPRFPDPCLHGDDARSGGEKIYFFCTTPIFQTSCSKNASIVWRLALLSKAEGESFLLLA